mgnify:FL=1
MKTCALCNRPIHHTNKSGLCRHCWSIRALTQALRAKGIVR